MNELEMKQAQISSLLESLSYQIHPDNEEAFDLLGELEMAFDDLNGEIGKMEDQFILKGVTQDGQGKDYPRAS